jgi:hypothetical protein
MQIRVEVKDNGDINIVRLCLATDSWLDYLAFKEDARGAFARGDVKACARFLRAGATRCITGKPQPGFCAPGWPNASCKAGVSGIEALSHRQERCDDHASGRHRASHLRPGDG